MAACNALVAAVEQAEREQEWQQEQQKEQEWQQEQQKEQEWQQEHQKEQEWHQEQQTEKEWQQEQQKEKEWQQEQQTEKEWQKKQQTEKEWQQEQQKEKEWQQEQQKEKEKGGEPPVSKRKPPPVRSPVVCGLGLQLEMAEMAELLYNRVGRFCFSLCICLYLYGDLAIYCTAVAKSIRDITCTPSEVGMLILYPLTSSRLVH
jgi:hypothetical protein